MANDAGAEATFLDLADYPLPLYDGDLEDSKGIPENANKLFDMFKSHDGLLISSPEYNSSLSPLLKNTIDWVSRPRPGEQRLGAYVGKVAGIMGASPGELGGLRGLVHVRSILSSIGVLVIPEQVAVGNAHQVFAKDGSLTDEKLAGRLQAAVESLVKTADRLNS